jgi:hypothetical protein
MKKNKVRKITKTVFDDHNVCVHYTLRVSDNSEANCKATLPRNVYFDIVGNDVRKIKEYLEIIQNA